MNKEAKKTTPEFPMGVTVPILQHRCASGKLGTFGTVTALDRSGNPVEAKCLDCYKIVGVDLVAIRQEQMNRNK